MLTQSPDGVLIDPRLGQTRKHVRRLRDWKLASVFELSGTLTWDFLSKNVGICSASKNLKNLNGDLFKNLND